MSSHGIAGVSAFFNSKSEGWSQYRRPQIKSRGLHPFQSFNKKRQEAAARAVLRQEPYELSLFDGVTSDSY